MQPNPNTLSATERQELADELLRVARRHRMLGFGWRTNGTGGRLRALATYMHPGEEILAIGRLMEIGVIAATPTRLLLSAPQTAIYFGAEVAEIPYTRLSRVDDGRGRVVTIWDDDGLKHSFVVSPGRANDAIRGVLAARVANRASVTGADADVLSRLTQLVEEAETRLLTPEERKSRDQNAAHLFAAGTMTTTEHDELLRRFRYMDAGALTAATPDDYFAASNQLTEMEDEIGSLELRLFGYQAIVQHYQPFDSSQFADAMSVISKLRQFERISSDEVVVFVDGLTAYFESWRSTQT